MRRLLKSLVLAACALAPLSAAAQNRRPLKQAEDAMNEASRQVRRAGPQCRNVLESRIDGLLREVRALGNDADAWEVQRVERNVASVASSAGFANCPDGVLASLYRAGESLDDVRTSRWNQRPDDRRNDQDDERSRFGEMKPLQVQANAQFDGEPAVRVTIPEITLRNMRGQQFYVAARFKSLQGNWSEWTATQQWTVPSDPFVWKNAFTHYFRSSTLAEEDFAGGRFVARVSVFDARGREVVSREAQFRSNLPQLPPGPSYPPPLVQQRDCGTGPDLGCTMMRDGRWAMDAATFQGFQRALQANNGDLMRQQTAQTMFTSQYVTAVQFGLVLDMFNSEMSKMQVAQSAARRLVNPQHAIGYAEKFNNSLYQQQYTQLMAAQNGVGQPLPPPGPGPGYPMPPPQQQVAVRDCGTGPNDVGCSMSRNGRWAMDAPTWGSLYNALRGQTNEIRRRDMLQQLFANQMLTAVQLGLVLDLFSNEIYRRDMAAFCAPRVVNPLHAVGLSNKFNNSIYARDFVTLMSQQR